MKSFWATEAVLMTICLILHNLVTVLIKQVLYASDKDRKLRTLRMEYLVIPALAYENEEIIIIMDQAGWHKSKDLVVPDNIEILYFPPYSPELNPIERLWKYMKTNFIHKGVFDSLKYMMAQRVDVFENLNNHTVASLCHCSYLDL